MSVEAMEDNPKLYERQGTENDGKSKIRVS